MVKKNDPITHQLQPDLITHQCKATGKTLMLPTEHCPFCMSDISESTEDERS